MPPLNLEENLKHFGPENQEEVIKSLYDYLGQVSILGLISLEEVLSYIEKNGYLKKQLSKDLKKDEWKSDSNLNASLIEIHKCSIEYLNNNPDKELNIVEKIKYFNGNSLLLELIVLQDLFFDIPIKLEPETIKRAKDYLKENRSFFENYEFIENAFLNYLNDLIENPKPGCLHSEDIIAYTDRELKKEQEEAAGMHIGQCNDCYRSYQMALKMNKILEDK